MSESVGIHPEDRDLIAKLAKLQNIHGQIRDLRVLFPERLLKPTRMAIERPNSTSPGQLAAHLRSAAAQGSKDILHFKKDFRGEDMQELWQKVNTTNLHQGMDAWTMDYQKLIASNPEPIASTAAKTNEESLTEKKEDIEAIIKDFKDTHPAIKMYSASESALLPLTIQVDEMSFQITSEEEDGRTIYRFKRISDEAPTKFTQEIYKSMQDNDGHQSFELTLSQLASYQDFRFQHCHKCGDIISNDLRFAIARKRKAPINLEDKKIEWLPYHFGCLP